MCQNPARFHSSSIGIAILMTLISVSLLIVIPFTLSIMYSYHKHKAHLTNRIAKYKTGFCYFTSTIIFCLNYCGRLLNDCFGCGEYDYIFVCSTTVIYGLHFVLLIYLLVTRIYLIFRDTAYRLSIITISVFIGLCAFVVIDMALFVLIVWVSNDQNDWLIFITYTIGVATIILLTFCSTLLYIYKLFQIIRKNKASKSKLVLENDTLVKSITKYTNLAVIWISSSVLFWCIPYTVNQFDYNIYLIMYHLFILLDIASNTIAFALGYHFSDNLYTKACSGTDHLLKALFIRLIQKKRKQPRRPKPLSQDQINLAEYVNNVYIENNTKTMQIKLPMETPIETPLDTQIQFTDAYSNAINQLNDDKIVEIDYTLGNKNAKVKLSFISTSAQAPDTVSAGTSKLKLKLKGAVSAGNDRNDGNTLTNSLINDDGIRPYNGELISVKSSPARIKADVIKSEHTRSATNASNHM